MDQFHTWTNIAKYLSNQDLYNLSLVSKYHHLIAHHDNVWIERVNHQIQQRTLVADMDGIINTIDNMYNKFTWSEPFTHSCLDSIKNTCASIKYMLDHKPKHNLWVFYRLLLQLSYHKSSMSAHVRVLYDDSLVSCGIEFCQMRIHSVLDDINVLPLHVTDIQLWHTWFGANCIVIPSAVLITKLLDHLAIKHTKYTQWIRYLLIYTELISVGQWNNLIKSFGPVEQLVHNIDKYLISPHTRTGFVGHIGRSKAYELLHVDLVKSGRPIVLVRMDHARLIVTSMVLDTTMHDDYNIEHCLSIERYLTDKYPDYQPVNVYPSHDLIHSNHLTKFSRKSL